MITSPILKQAVAREILNGLRAPFSSASFALLRAPLEAASVQPGVRLPSSRMHVYRPKAHGWPDLASRTALRFNCAPGVEAPS